MIRRYRIFVKIEINHSASKFMRILSLLILDMFWLMVLKEDAKTILETEV